MKAITLFSLCAACASALQAESEHSGLDSSLSTVQGALEELRSIEANHVEPAKRMGSVTQYILSFLKLSLPKLQSQTAAVAPRDYESPLRQLRAAADAGDADALFLLAEMSFHGNYSYPRNFQDARHYYTELAELNGNMTANEQLAFLYSTGIDGSAANQALAVTYHTFASSQGSIRSNMAMGYRYLHGIGVTNNCSTACEHYSSAADAALKWMKSGPPGGMYWTRQAFRYSDDHGGLYGSAPPRSYHTKDASDIDDVIDYYTYLAERSDLQAAFSLAKLYNDGSRTVEQDFIKSLYWFRQVAKSYWTKDGKVVKNAKLMKMHAKSAAYIGIAYLRGEGTDQDFDKARMWFQRAIALGENVAQNGLGLMHLHGLGAIPRDIKKAEELFKAAADSEHKGAQINLGKMMAAKGDMVAAARYFESAARAGRVEAFYYLAQFYEHGIGREKNCAMATQYYKIVSESVETLQSTIPFANKAYLHGHIQDAIIANMIAAESGYEIGQLNVGFLLDQHKRKFSIKEIIKAKFTSKLDFLKAANSNEEVQSASDLEFDDELALRYYSRSASQQNLEALIKAGDYHLEGRGTPQNPEKAVEMWTAAAETRVVPLALWNLGWSYENGVGVEQDFHLAKRYYDACLETDKRAYLPVSLSLFKLRVRSAWNTASGGSINSIRDEDTSSEEVSWSTVWAGFKHFWRSQFDYTKHSQEGEDGAANDVFVDDDYPSMEDDLYETLIIFGICFLVAAAVYLRTTWNQNRQDAGAAGPRNNAVQGANPHVAEWIVSCTFSTLLTIQGGAAI